MDRDISFGNIVKEHRQAQQERTRRNLQRGFVGALIVGLIVAIGLSVFALNQRQEARRQASIGLASLAEGELDRADRQLGVLLATALRRPAVRATGDHFDRIQPARQTLLIPIELLQYPKEIFLTLEFHLV
jgi:hypothetical protein